MREAESLLERRGRTSSVAVLARTAAALHGPGSVEEKLAWLLGALRSATGAKIAFYTGFGFDPERRTAADGVSTYEVDVLARPVVMGREIWAVDPVDEQAAVLRRDRRWRLFLDRADMERSAAVLAVLVPSAEPGRHGVLVVGRDGEPFDGEDRAVTEALASHLGVALDNELRLARLAELQEVQREVVHQLQEAVRPPVPTVEGAELGVHFLPADPSAPTGGDLHDWLVLADGDVFLAVVDVMGKGVAATKDAVAITHALRLLVLDGCPIGDLVARADALLTAHNPEVVATVVAARYRPSDGHLWLAGGGQPPALWVTAGGDVKLVSTPGVALGWPGAGTSEVVELSLERNDTIVLYTDGLIESTKDVLAGLDNLQRAAAQIASYPSTHVARSLVERSLSGAKRRDDSLALVLRRRTPPAPDSVAPLAPFEYQFSPVPATIPLARHLLGDWLDHLSVDDAERADLLLVASELCSNAVRHASGTPRAVTLRASAEGDAVAIEVEDDGEGFQLQSRYDDEIPDPALERGRGLYVVEALSDETSVRRVVDRTIVRAVRRAVLPHGR